MVVAPTRAELLTGVSKRFARKGLWVLREVDLALTPGSCTLIIGGNGSGKSTLARLVVGLTRPNAGTVTTPAAAGYVPERLWRLLCPLTVTDYLAHMGRIGDWPGAISPA